MSRKERELVKGELEQVAGGLTCLPDVLHCGPSAPNLPKGIAGWSVEPLQEPTFGGVTK